MRNFWALGLIGLKTLDKENEIRIRNHNLLTKYLNNKFFKVIEPAKGAYAVFYSNLIGKTSIRKTKRLNK